MEYLWPALLILSLFMFFGLTLFGLPGNWLMLLACIGYAAFYIGNVNAMMGWGTVIAIGIVVVIAEILEFVAGAAGVKKGALLAILGSIAGSMVGASLGSVVPVLGTIVGVLIGASLGAMAGAMVGEHWAGNRDADLQWEIGKAAFWGRLWGALGKIVVGAIVIGMATVAVFF